MGGIGLSSLMACKYYDLGIIVVIDISDEKLKLAKIFGASHVINSSKQDTYKEINKITKGKGFDYSVEAAGSVETIENAFRFVRNKGGKCYFASHPSFGDKIKLDPFDLISGKQLYGSWGGKSKPDKDIPSLANMYKKGLLPLEKLISKEYTLNEINKALDDLEQGKVFRPLIKMK